MSKNRMAIDPGFSGAIVWEDSKGVVQSQNMPQDYKEISDFIKNIVYGQNLDCPNYLAVMEQVGGYQPGNSGPAAVKFGRHCGNLEAILYCLGIETVFVLPKEWQKSMPLTEHEPIKKTVEKSLAKKMRSDRKIQRKNEIKDHAIKSFPHLKVTLKNADALGILLWAKDKNLGI